MSRIAVLAACGALLSPIGAVLAQAPPVATFAASPRISDASISPDGRYLAVITFINKGQTLVIQDRTASGPGALHAVLAAADGFQLSWCRWVSDERVLCGLTIPMQLHGILVYKTRLVAADANGQNAKTLLEDMGDPGVPYLSRVLAWDVPGKPGTVLVEGQVPVAAIALQDSRVFAERIGERPLPSVFELNTLTGEFKQAIASHDPLQFFLADEHGDIVLGWGPSGMTDTEYDVRDPQTQRWRKVATLPGHLTPVALCAAALNCAYALGDSDGHTALWRIDLTGKQMPTVEFAHPSADLSTAMLARDGHLFGVRYDTAEPMVYYVDTPAARIIDNLKRLLPGQFIELMTYTRDGAQMILKASSDTDPGSFFLYDLGKNTLARVGAAYPNLAADRIGHMQPQTFVARDGTLVPAFLTLPSGAGQNLPLIALPHGGKFAHDAREFNLLRAFLVSRGYAVLQVNYRGSSGRGAQWQSDFHGDWGGLPYTDVVDGVKWAVKQGIADGQRVCIIGTDYSGYLALLGAERDPDLFRCAVSVGGYSDFALPVPGAMPMMGMGPPGGGPGGHGGPSLDQLQAESPHRHAQDFKVPVLLVHGDQDAVVTVDQSKAMDAALTAAHKPHQFVLLTGADHDFSSEDDRAKLFTALESFLATNLH